MLTFRTVYVIHKYKSPLKISSSASHKTEKNKGSFTKKEKKSIFTGLFWQKRSDLRPVLVCMQKRSDN